MKVLCLIVLACAAVAINARPEKRQLAIGLAALEPILSKFLLDKLHIGKWIGKAVGSISGLIKGKHGDVTVPNSTLKLHYVVDRCHLKFGKRFIKGIIPREHCKATVSEPTITKTSTSCTTHVQASALNCAMEGEIKKIQALAQQAAKQQG